ncbi:MAG: phosphate/phosphite/phosphonate ABC transporter substrate-binding protein [Pseudomonadota bacterium]
MNDVNRTLVRTILSLILPLGLLSGLSFGSLAFPHVALAASPPQACENPNPMRFSLIPRTDLARQMEEHRPLIQYLEKALGRKVVVIQSSSYSTVIEGLLAGSIDLASMGPASYALARNRDESITPFVTWTIQGGVFVKPGSATYNSLLIVRHDSPFRDIADLKGRSVSLTDPASTSGGVLPRAEFSAQTGVPLEEYFDRVTYSGSHDRSIDTVKKGYADAAFVASEHLDNVIRRGGIEASEVRVLWQSRPIPHDPFVYRGKLCPELRERIREIFLSDAPAIRVMLGNLKAERFAPVGDEDYIQIREILSRGGG